MKSAIIAIIILFLSLPQLVCAQEVITCGEHLFVSQPVPKEIQNRMMGKSMPDDIPVPFDELRYLSIPYYDYDSQIQIGEMVCNKAIANDLLVIFRSLFEARYQINSIRLVDDFGASDDVSMRANNTSCFNYRTIKGSCQLSRHAFGMAVDINPVQNPFLRHGKIMPSNAVAYVDRGKPFPHKIDKNDLAYQLFKSHGFIWGGSWQSKDYQHFEK